MSEDKKKPAAKKPAASKTEGVKPKQAAVKAAPAKKNPAKPKAPPKKAGRPRKHPVKPAVRKLPPQTRNVKATPPVTVPPTNEVIEEALNDGLSPQRD